ncbi:DNA polymerase III subunit alpha [Pantoea sp. Mhis]|uniref:DNA polymerase III subunit alpha n=1 Tax=Pantoea sp. Mhis TaxID=2576759 RepID=UPI00135A920B|nr:DNA polymerase III subunit alpha [Pantoea sp. Mhis]MXP56362.1 DNA polymerase III subunit alpha [Pantoea sp. Mhis]
MAEPHFIHLRVHSDYSMVNGLAKIGDLVNKVSLIGMPAVAITDFMNLCGLIRFYNSAQKLGIKPIIGADFNVFSKLTSDDFFQLTLLAISNKGYRNLTLLISRAYQRGYSVTGPVIDRDWLIELGEDLILLSGGCKGDVGLNLLRGNNNLVLTCLNFYSKYFPNRYYLELTRTDRPNEEEYLCAAVELAITKNIPVVATNQVCFLNEDDFDAHEIRVAIHDGYTLNDSKRPCNYSSKQYMRTPEEMCKIFSDIPEALKNSVEIAKRCNVTICLGKYFLPEFPTGNITTENFLIMKSRQGLENRLKILFPNNNVPIKNKVKYYKRLYSELDVINKMGFPSYFLIVMEFIQWSKDNGIPVGPGRGSGAGSLVAYALNITDLDPIEFGLLFERFLNPERISMPDFDIDFCMEKRDQVIEHVAETYGRAAVSQIITFGTLTAKAVIRDVGRVLGYPYGFVDRISKMIPLDPGMTLKKAFAVEPQLSEIYAADEEVKTLINMAFKLEGVTRNAGKHAGGVVIAPTKITDFAPLYCDENGDHPLTQFDKHDVEHAGLVKFDFLGLRTLTIIDSALKMINTYLTKQKLELINLANISLNDKKCFDILQRAETTAIFQLESRGMKELIKRLKPDCFEDMIALVALFRPGPLQSGMVDNFINRKHGRERIFYPDVQWQHSILKPVLESTYGIILYQEQVMKIAQVFAGYTLGAADMLRRAMEKKQTEEMFQHRYIFQEGAKKLGIDAELSKKIFNLLEKFAGYGFNKSHSAAYALISYQTLWLKTHYPAQFMASVMSADMDNTNKMIILVDECLRLGLKVLPPDVNCGLYQFHVNNKGEIVYGMGAIKGVGEVAIEEIINARNIGGYFVELFDFCARVDTKKINRRMIEKLIMSGALDSLGAHRSLLIHQLESAIQTAEQNIKDQLIGQVDMFGILEAQSSQVKKIDSNILPWSEQMRLDQERQSLGLYLTGHPINQYLKEIKHYVPEDIRLKDIYSSKHGTIIVIAGIVISIHTMITKRGNRIGFCTLDDSSAFLEIILFSDILDKYQNILKKDHVLIVSGQVIFDKFKSSIKMIAYKIMNIDTARKKYVSGISILLLENQMNDQLLNNLAQVLETCHSGDVLVHIHYQKNSVQTKLVFKKKWRILLSDSLMNNLRSLVGTEQVTLEFK